MFKGPWVIGGDFNGTADELRKTGWLELVKGTIIQPSGKTCSRKGGRTLDFFVVSNCLVSHVVGAYNIGDADMVKTHSPVRLIIGSKPRDDGVWCIKVPSAHVVDLPAGPVNKCIPTARADYAHEELGMTYVGCINLIEEELVSIAGFDGKEAVQFCGRAEGPTFVLKKA